MTFEATRRQPTQEHFYLVEIDLPIITGLCELTVGVEGYGTPLFCPIQDGTSATVMQTYTFASDNAPLLAQSPVYRCLTGVSESATELNNGKGLAFSGGGTASFQDFKGDPNPERSASVLVKDQGTFFGKWYKRNVFENREVRIIKYRKSPTLNLATDGQISYYTSRSLKNNGRGKYQLIYVDELARLDFDQAQIPAEQNSFLRLDINDTVTAIPVDAVTDWSQKTTPYVIRIGEEFQTVTAVANNQTASASLTVATRGAVIGLPQFTKTLTKSQAEEHAAGDEVFICITFDSENIADALEELLLGVDMPSSIIPIVDWQAEVAEWLPASTLTGIFYESESADEAILRVLEPYMLDMWYDPIDREIKLKAISGWVEDSGTLTEDKEIDFESLSIAEVENLRFETATISYDKTFLSNAEESSNYKRRSIATRPDLQTVELYGTESKTKVFNRSTFIDKDDGDLVTSRYVQRFGITPQRMNWTTQERFMNFKTGDVKRISSPEVQGADGLPSDNTRAQIIRIQPKDSKIGREYKVTALTYQPAISSGAVFTVNNATELNLFILAGAPPSDVDLTFIFDGGVFNSTLANRAAVQAGGFSSGSKLIVILRNGADWSSKGGGGGDGETGVYDTNDNLWVKTAPKNGIAGGIVYDAQGIDTDIYLSGADPESGTALGKLRAPAGGDGGLDGSFINGNPSGVTGDGGNAGDGIDPGFGGVGNSNGDNGQTDGSGSGFGVDGVDNDATKGDAGSGIIKNGGTVKVFGSTGVNFINGNGDTPDV